MTEGKTTRGCSELLRGCRWEGTKILMETEAGGRGQQCKRFDERQRVPAGEVNAQSAFGMSYCQPRARALNSLGKGGERTPGCGSGTTLMLV